MTEDSKDNNVYQQARENLQSMSDEKLQSYRDRLEGLEKEGVKISDQDQYSQETATQALQAFKDAFQERGLGEINKNIEDMKKESKNGTPDDTDQGQQANKQSQSDTPNQSQANTNQANQTTATSINQQESSQKQLQDGGQDQQKAQEIKEQVGIPKADEGYLDAKEIQIVNSKLAENRKKIANMTDQEWNKRIENVRDQYDTGEAEGVIEMAQSYREQEKRAKELSNMSVEDIYQLDKDGSLTSEDKNLLKERNAALYKQYTEYKETKGALDNADQILNGDKKKDTGKKDKNKSTKQSGGKPYDEVINLINEKNKALNKNEEITKLEDTLAEQQNKLNNIEEKMKKVKKETAKKFPNAGSATLTAIISDRQSDLMSRKRTLQNNMQATRQKLQNRKENIQSTYENKIEVAKLRLQQKEYAYNRKLKLKEFQQNKEYKEAMQKLSEQRFQFSKNKWQAEQQREKNAIQRYAQKQMIKAKIDNAFKENTKDTELWTPKDSNTAMLLNSQTGEVIAKYNAGKLQNGSLDDDFGTGKIHLSYDTETNKIKASKSFTQVRNTDSKGNPSIGYFYSTGRKGFIERMNIKRGGQTINQATNNPGKITADWLSTTKAKKEYAKEMGAIGTHYNKENNREYFVFEDPASGFRALKSDIAGKQTGRTQTSLGPQSTLKSLLDTYVGHDINKSPGYRDAVLQQVFGTTNRNNLKTSIGTIHTGPLAKGISKAEGYGDVSQLKATTERQKGLLGTTAPETIRVPEDIDKLQQSGVPLSSDFKKMYNELDTTYRTFVEQQLSGNHMFDKISINDETGRAAKVALAEAADSYQEYIKKQTGDKGFAKIYSSASNLNKPSNNLKKLFGQTDRLMTFIGNAQDVSNNIIETANAEGSTLTDHLKRKVNTKKFWESQVQTLGISENAAAIFGKTIEQRLSDLDLKRYIKVMPSADKTKAANNFLTAFLKSASAGSLITQMEREADNKYLRNKVDTYNKYNKIYKNNLRKLEAYKCKGGENTEQCVSKLKTAIKEGTIKQTYGN